MPHTTPKDAIITTHATTFAQIAFALPVRQTFVYRVPSSLAGQIQRGAEVEAPFRGRARRGFVIELEAESAREKVLDIKKVLGAPILTDHLLELGSWVSDYYLAPLGEVLSTALPGGFEGFARSRARKAAQENPVVPLALPDRLTLTREQRDAVCVIEKSIALARFAPILLHGVTASGKTEVYLRAARAAREAGGQALVLVPEVALGAQVVASFRKRFGDRVGILHSYLTVGERRRTWQLASRGALDVIVGARSAVFAPLPNIKLIVVDEEHEPAYKQSEQVRYHGRDTAVRRAQMLGVPVVLGSATPSIESLANAARGKYTTVRMPKRVDCRALPTVRLIDLRRDGTTGGMLSPTLRAALAERQARGEQSVLFLNRRGHSHHTQCRQCGHVPECPHCDIALTLHVTTHDWQCHYCGHSKRYQPDCPSCSARLLRFSGGGTQRAERELISAFPSLRVLRLDTDVARARHRPGEILRAFADGKADVLLGTQMIAKGLDFPRVTLVGVLDADVALHLPDFRAGERTFQLLVQVAGRAGRGQRPGEVLVQTCTPEHPAIAAAVLHDEAAFLRHELAIRREAGYPPYTRLIALLFSGRDERQVENVARAAAETVRPDAQEHGIQVLGPAPQSLARLRGQHRWHVLLKGMRARMLHNAASAALEQFERARRSRTVRIMADVDPTDVL